MRPIPSLQIPSEGNHPPTSIVPFSLWRSVSGFEMGISAFLIREQPMNQGRLVGKVAVITGAARGKGVGFGSPQTRGEVGPWIRGLRSGENRVGK